MKLNKTEVDMKKIVDWFTKKYEQKKINKAINQYEKDYWDSDRNDNHFRNDDEDGHNHPDTYD